MKLESSENIGYVGNIVQYCSNRYVEKQYGNIKATP